MRKIDLPESEICADYLRTRNKQYVMNKYSLNNYRFYACLKRNNIEPKSYKSQNFKQNTNAFLNLDSDKSGSYFLGLLVADGNLTDSGAVQISLKESDKFILEKLKEYVGSNSELIYREKTKSFSFSFKNKIIYERLITYGLAPRKSTNEEVKNFKINPDFIRGLLDGDGRIGVSTSKSATVDLCGSKFITKLFCDFVEQSVNLKNKKVPKLQQETKIYRVGFYGSEAKELLKMVYYDGCLCIERKLKSVQQALRLR